MDILVILQSLIIKINCFEKNRTSIYLQRNILFLMRKFECYLFSVWFYIFSQQKIQETNKGFSPIDFNIFKIIFLYKQNSRDRYNRDVSRPSTTSSSSSSKRPSALDAQSSDHSSSSSRHHHHSNQQQHRGVQDPRMSNSIPSSISNNNNNSSNRRSDVCISSSVFCFVLYFV